MSNKLIMALLVLTTCFSGYAAEEKIKLQSGDGKDANGPIFEVSKELFSEYSKTLRDMFEEIQKAKGKAGEDQKAEDDKTPIPLPNINGNTLDIIIYCVQQPDDAEGILLSLNEEQLRAVTAAIRFLDIPKLYAQLPQVKWVEESIAKNTKPITLSGSKDFIFSVAFSPDNTSIVTGVYDGTVIIWDADTGKQQYTLKGCSGKRFPGFILSVAFSPDNTSIVTGAENTTAIIWNANTGEKKLTLEGHTGPILSAAFSNGNTSIVTGSVDKTAIIWDANTGEKKLTLKGLAQPITSVAFSPDNRSIFTGTSEGTAIIWNANTGEKKLTLEGHTDSILSAAFSPDNTSIVTGSFDKTAIIWNANTGEKRHTLKGHKDSILSVAFSPDNTSIVTGSVDKTAIIWDAKSGKPIRTLEGHTGIVNSVAFNPDNTSVVTGSTDKTAIIWPLYNNPEQLNTLPQADLQDLIIRIYIAKDSGVLSLNKDQSALYKNLPKNLQKIFGRYVKLFEPPKS